MTKDISIEELLEDYRVHYTSQDLDERTLYYNKVVEVVEYLMIGRFDILPYQDDDGKCDYRLKVRSQ